MKKMIIALALTATAAHAEGINLNKDCSKPLSKYGVDILESQPVYKAYRQTFDRAFSRFCEDGKKLQNEMGFEAANARASIEAARWMRKEFADDLEPNQRGMFESLLAAAGMGGYTGFDLPRDPTPPRSEAAEAQKAAADKAAAAKVAAARKAQATQPAARGVDISGYATQIRDAIEAKIPRPEQYAGKRCLLQMNLARDGMVISTRSEGGDPALCQAALFAVQQAKIPPAPNDEVYQVVRGARLDFQL